MLNSAVALIATTIPVSVLARRSDPSNDGLLLLLYIVTVAGVLAWLCLPMITWEPTTETLFGIEAWRAE